MASVERKGIRLVGVIFGGKTGKSRDQHLMGLFKGLHGAKEIRRFLTQIDSIDNPIEQYKQLALGFNE